MNVSIESLVIMKLLIISMLYVPTEAYHNYEISLYSKIAI